MILAELTPRDWRKIYRLISKKDRLKTAIATIDRQLDGFQPGSATGPAGRKPKPARKRRKAGQVGRGDRTDSIVAALRAAGPKGIRVRDLAGKLKTTQGNIRSWFFSRGKKMKEIVKAGHGKYRWV